MLLGKIDLLHLIHTMTSQTFIFFFLLLMNFLCLEATKTSNYLQIGSSISVKNNAGSKQLISPDKTFTCGFYNSLPNAYHLAIWFTTSLKDKTIVWMANRDNPANGHGSRLTLRKNGVLVLTDLDGSVVWETNTTSTNAIKVELLNSGNLVLKDAGKNTLWQSFDFPTNTLLPNQPFTKTTKLVSNCASQVFASGEFSFLFNDNNVLILFYDGPETSSLYWPYVDSQPDVSNRKLYNSSIIATLNDIGTFVSSDHFQFNASDMGIGIKRRLTMDYDGNLRLYSLNSSTGFWVVTWQAVTDLCTVHGLCGRNGICVHTPEPKCSCPPYFEPNVLSDLSKGCKPTFRRSCSDSHFVKVIHVKYFALDLNLTPSSTSFKHCRKLCLEDCRCQGFSYRLTEEATCYLKNALFNGYRSNGYAGNTYLKIPSREKIAKRANLNVSTLECRNGVLQLVVWKASQIKWVYLFSFITAFGAIEVVFLFAGWLFLYRKHGMTALEDGYVAISSQFRSFSYSELKKATAKFKEVLGRGGFGIVYKGVLEDQRVVAVKKLEGVVQGDEGFWAEVSIIGKVNHMNLARMLGFCSKGRRRLLVSEHVENGSLDKHLFTSSTNNNVVLGWKERFKIALGTAKGLAYLHHECLEWVMHCDVKPENILLDSDFEPKVSDFGLAKLCQRGGHGPSQFSRVRGTKGYMAPEWTTNLPLTSKVDVYSYGVVILELVSGIRLSSQTVDDLVDENDHEKEGIADLTGFVRNAEMIIQSQDESWLDDLVDPRLEGSFSSNQATVMINVGLSCVENDRNKRPTMESVVQILTECDDEYARN